MISVFLILLAVVALGLVNNALTIVSLGLMITIVCYVFPILYKKATYFYVLAFIVTVLGIVFYEDYYTRIVQGGLLGYSFILIVMMVSVLPNKNVIARNVKRNRGVLSILGFIFISSHVYLHVLGLVGDINLYGVAAYVIMAPLTFISFRVIRKEINPKDWFRIQKAAYAVYGLLFIHIMLVATPDNQIIYAVLMTLYVNNRILKRVRK